MATLKETRLEQLEELKQSDKVAPLHYVVETLNDSFNVSGRQTFDTMEAAEMYYQRKREYFAPAFLRKYATVSF